VVSWSRGRLTMRSDRQRSANIVKEEEEDNMHSDPSLTICRKRSGGEGEDVKPG